MLPRYRSSVIKKSVTKKSKSRINKSESLLWLTYVVMMHRVAAAAEMNAKENRQNSISRENVRIAKEEFLDSYYRQDHES